MCETPLIEGTCKVEVCCEVVRMNVNENELLSQEGVGEIKAKG